jgi:chemotaxis protein methyltransferase CheR
MQRNIDFPYPEISTAGKTSAGRHPDWNTSSHSLAQIILESVREPLLVLDYNLRILFASSSFSNSFQLDPETTRGESLFALDHGAWNIPGLRAQLNIALAGHPASEGLEITHEFPRTGTRTVHVRIRNLISEDDGARRIVLGIEDLTERRAVEREETDRRAPPAEGNAARGNAA